MQLELFDWTPSSAEIIVFPVDRRDGRIESLARRIMLSGTEALANKRWQVAVNRLRAELASLGLDQTAQTAHIDCMATAVQHRLETLASEQKKSGS